MGERGTGRRPGRAQDDRGAAAVEFALVVLPLLYLVFGIISYGYMLAFRQSISQAAAEGARAAAVAPVGLTETELRARARDAVNDSLASYDVSCDDLGHLLHGSDDAGDCTISGPEPCDAGTTSPACVTVTLAYAYDDEPLIPDVGVGIVLPDTLSFTSEVRVS